MYCDASMGGGDEGITCWICMCEEDKAGKPPVRDCSCRGLAGAGYAHASCIVAYAKVKNEASEGDDDVAYYQFLGPWQTCPRCEQSYQGELALLLANAAIAHAKERYKVLNQLKMIEALGLKSEAIERCDRDDLRAESKKASKELVTVAQSAKKSLPKPRSTYQDTMYEVVTDAEVVALNRLAGYCAKDGQHAAAIQWLEKARAIVQVKGDAEGMQYMDASINQIKFDHFGGNRPPSEEGVLQRERSFHEGCVRDSGETDASSIHAAADLAGSLLEANHGIEAERLLERYAPISLRVHGAEHDETTRIQSLLCTCKERMVGLYASGEVQFFEALRYEDDGDKCVIRGPCCTDIQSTRTVKSKALVAIGLGSPVVCHGLIKAAHLNGQLGDLRSYDTVTGRYGVHFERKDLKPVLVKKENLRIVFDLPGVE